MRKMNYEIATLPSVVRNDKEQKEMATLPSVVRNDNVTKLIAFIIVQ